MKKYVGENALRRIVQKMKALINGKADVSHTHNEYFPKTGGTINGNIQAQNVTATWLQTTSTATHTSTKSDKIAVIGTSGWIYHRTPSEILTDIGGAKSSHTHTTANISGLDNTLNSKATKFHNHTDTEIHVSQAVIDKYVALGMNRPVG